MNRSDANSVTRQYLHDIACAGYATASEHVETIILKNVTTACGGNYEVELSYLWKDEERVEILVICKITSKDWFRHEQLQESITLCSEPF